MGVGNWGGNASPRGGECFGDERKRVETSTPSPVGTIALKWPETLRGNTEVARYEIKVPY